MQTGLPVPVRKRWAMTRPDPGRFLLGAVLEDSAGRRQRFRPAVSSLPACFRAYATRLWRVHLHGLPQRSLARAASRYSWTTLQPLPVARRRGRRDRRVLLTARVMSLPMSDPAAIDPEEGLVAFAFIARRSARCYVVAVEVAPATREARLVCSREGSGRGKWS